MADFVRIRAADIPKDGKPDGARLRLIRDDGEGTCELYDEQVTYPERVHNPNAANFKFQNHIALNENEQRWLRDAMTEMLGEPADAAALHDEIAKLRAGIPPQINAVFAAAKAKRLAERDFADATNKCATCVVEVGPGPCAAHMPVFERMILLDGAHDKAIDAALAETCR